MEHGHWMDVLRSTQVQYSGQGVLKLLRNIGRPACMSMLVLFFFTRLAAVDYMTQEEAFAAAFPEATISQITPELSREQAQLVMSKAASKARGKFSGIYVAHRGQQVQGVCFIDNAIGRTEFFTYACSLNSDGSVKRIDVITYREPKGMEIKQRNWLQRFVGKTYGDTLRVKKDIPNISGASLSCKAMVERVRFMVTYYNLVLARQVQDWVKEQSLPAKDAVELKQMYQYEQSAVISEPILRLSFPHQEHESEVLKTHAEKMIAVARHWDALSNTWNADSELSQLIAVGGGVASVELAGLINRIFDLSQQTKGAVDPCLGALMTLWQDAQRKNTMPTTDAVQSALKVSGLKQITWDCASRTLKIPSQVAFDVSAFNKGWIVDQLRRYAEEQRLQVVINFGESSYAAVACDVTIQLRQAGSAETKAIQLTAGQCLASSGAYHRRFTIADQTFSHFINAQTGHLLQGQRAASVLSDEAIVADVWATAACILPRKDLQAVLEQHSVAASIWRDDELLQLGLWAP